ncbi:hypothetical protein RND81_03G193800 [Saponaria officinalis]|uniref:FLZ-type domain-containing protein n=1 Tax=Saponaria officinalis TaxID=3572 RepID=A0AAW1M8J4_SAPOF
MGSLGKARSSINSRVMFYGGIEDMYTHHHQQQPHFLESCFLCHKPLGPNNDIFMYRGNTPFCSEECRQEQIETDEAKERCRNLSTSYRAHRKVDNPTNSGSKKPVQSGTTLVVA